MEGEFRIPWERLGSRLKFLRFAAILLVIFGLTAKQALAEFIELSTDVLELEGGPGAGARTDALRSYIDSVLDRYGISKDMPIMHPNGCSRGCKL